MKQDSKALLWAHGKLALSLALLAGLTGLAFAGWLNNADGIFLSVVESGLAWCM